MAGGKRLHHGRQSDSVDDAARAGYLVSLKERLQAIEDEPALALGLA